MRIAGVDASLNATGIATPDGFLLTLKQKAKDGDRRLLNIQRGVKEHVIDHGAELVMIEDLPRNAMGAGITGMVQGAVRTKLLEAGVQYVLVSPATLKQFATSKGNAKKPDMRQAWLDLTGEDNPRDDEVDAAFLRYVGLYLAGEIPQERPHWDAAESFRPQVEAIASGWELS